MHPMDLVWVTAKGERVWISQMETSHLANTKALIERKGWGGRFPQYHRICRELEVRTILAKRAASAA